MLFGCANLELPRGGRRRSECRGRGIDLRPLAGEHPQAHAAGRQVLHGVDQMGEVAAQPVELPDDEHVVLPQGAQTAVEPRPVVPAAGREVVVDVDRVEVRETGRGRPCSPCRREKRTFCATTPERRGPSEHREPGAAATTSWTSPCSCACSATRCRLLAPGEFVPPAVADFIGR